MRAAVVIRRMNETVEEGEEDARRVIGRLVAEYQRAECAFKSGRMLQTDWNQVNDWVVMSRSVYAKALRLVTDHGFDVDYLVDQMGHVSTLYALAGVEIGEWAMEVLRVRFAGKVRKLRILSQMTNAAALARERMPYPFPDGRFKRLDEMSSNEAHVVATSISQKVNPEVMREMDGVSRRTALKAVVTRFVFERRDGRRVGVYQGYIVRDRREIIIDAENVESVRRGVGFGA